MSLIDISTNNPPAMAGFYCINLPDKLYQTLATVFLERKSNLLRINHLYNIISSLTEDSASLTKRMPLFYSLFQVSAIIKTDSKT